MGSENKTKELEPIKNKANLAIVLAYESGYNAAVDYASSRLEMIAAVLPSSVTKSQLIKLCADEARAIRARANK